METRKTLDSTLKCAFLALNPKWTEETDYPLITLDELCDAYQKQVSQINLAVRSLDKNKKEKKRGLDLLYGNLNKNYTLAFRYLYNEEEAYKTQLNAYLQQKLNEKANGLDAELIKQINEFLKNNALVKNLIKLAIQGAADRTHQVGFCSYTINERTLEFEFDFSDFNFTDLWCHKKYLSQKKLWDTLFGFKYAHLVNFKKELIAVPEKYDEIEQFKEKLPGLLSAFKKDILVTDKLKANLLLLKEKRKFFKDNQLGPLFSGDLPPCLKENNLLIDLFSDTSFVQYLSSPIAPDEAQLNSWLCSFQGSSLDELYLHIFYQLNHIEFSDEKNYDPFNEKINIAHSEWNGLRKELVKDALKKYKDLNDNNYRFRKIFSEHGDLRCLLNFTLGKNPEVSPLTIFSEKLIKQFSNENNTEFDDYFRKRFSIIIDNTLNKTIDSDKPDDYLPSIFNEYKDDGVFHKAFKEKFKKPEIQPTPTPLISVSENSNPTTNPTSTSTSTPAPGNVHTPEPTTLGSSTPTQSKSFYQRNKRLIWGAIGGTAIVLGLVCAALLVCMIIAATHGAAIPFAAAAIGGTAMLIKGGVAATGAATVTTAVATEAAVGVLAGGASAAAVGMTSTAALSAAMASRPDNGDDNVPKPPSSKNNRIPTKRGEDEAGQHLSQNSIYANTSVGASAKESPHEFKRRSIAN